MKWFDSLKKIKDIPTKLTGDGDVTQNLNKKSHRDIGKRGDFINLSRGVFHEVPDKSLGFSLSRTVDIFAEKISQMLASMTRGRWVVCLFLIFLGYIVYGLGFLIRTESNIQSLIDDPAQIVTNQGQHTVQKLFQDYQLIGMVAKNPIFPIEPLASYGYFLDYVRDFTATLNHLLGFKEELYTWYTGDGTQSIFSFLEKMFPYFSELSQESAGMMNAFGNLTQSTRLEEIDTMKHSLDAFIAHKDTWYDILGKNKLSRILLLNQNSDELRAGGGFPGTAFIIELDGGRVTRFQFYDIYALDWLLKGYRPSPEGINRFRSREYPGRSAEFEIRDANYFPTFHESATKIDEFTRAANIGNIDLVIGINQKFLEEIIKIVEPLNLPGIQVPIDHYNAMLILSMLVEGKKSLVSSSVTETKNRNTTDAQSGASAKGSVKILGKVIFDTLQSQNKMNQALYVLASHIFQGEVVAGSPRPDIQKALDDVGIFDRWRGKRGDWVYPLFTSISRNKSDRLMERTFEIEQVTTCERILTLSQKHWYDLTERNRIEDLARKLDMEDKIPLLLPVQGAGDNVQYLRFILPPGTQYLPQPKSAFSLLESTPLYTSIHGYETTSPGTTSILKIGYILPDGYCDEKSEFFKQPGLRNTRFLVKKGDKILYQTFYE